MFAALKLADYEFDFRATDGLVICSWLPTCDESAQKQHGNSIAFCTETASRPGAVCQGCVCMQGVTVHGYMHTLHAANMRSPFDTLS